MLLSSCCLLAGCAETSPVADVSSPPPTASAVSPDSDSPTTSAGAITFLDKAELQQGTGETDADPPSEFQTTESGLQYRILRKSDGEKATADRTVTVHYRGWLDDGIEFDSSYSRGETISFSLGGVIPGWTEGMQLVGKGGMIELWIPPDLGYGAAGAGEAVPPNATLHFVVELKEIQ
ncbi:MAG: FKBP-type peptidyl-prolyl cis-trans isomerase [Fuerstiella sp.]|jgi:FKBP-type peptidyl-prolyl cis-trans isomerase FkpA|nr:FKBP-type peptidyl-prolyl cis-trans isomerase [Fuerstiella sp.]MCP4507237.1 FKBP-type peptidyl-prolyl cis-trans isomerase [Fuerstiella sp.]